MERWVIREVIVPHPHRQKWKAGGNQAIPVHKVKLSSWTNFNTDLWSNFRNSEVWPCLVHIPVPGGNQLEQSGRSVCSPVCHSPHLPAALCAISSLCSFMFLVWPWRWLGLCSYFGVQRMFFKLIFLYSFDLGIASRYSFLMGAMRLER